MVEHYNKRVKNYVNQLLKDLSLDLSFCCYRCRGISSLFSLRYVGREMSNSVIGEMNGRNLKYLTTR